MMLSDEELKSIMVQAYKARIEDETRISAMIEGYRAVIAANNAKALEAALSALESERIMAADAQGNYTVEITPKRIIDAIKQVKAALAEPPSIANSIRNAAINWPQFLANEEAHILDLFAGRDWRWLLYCFGDEFEIQCRTFMLFVAEALE